MGTSITRKIIENHLISGRLKPGNEIGIRIDQTLTQDATGTMAYLQFESLKTDRVMTDLSVSYVDHNTMQVGFENAEDHRYLQTVAARYGLYFSRPGNGVCHQVHLERFGKPGKTLLGADSHTPTGGGLGMLAIGAGGLDVALAMGGAPFFLTCPNVVKIHLVGKLHPWVSAKDIILKVLELFTTKGNVDHVFEYAGEGLKHLSVPERATIANMGAECGVTTSVFPSDEVTRLFLKMQGRETDWVEIKADADAEYEQVVEINLSELVPLVAKPHSPDHIATVKDVEGVPVDQVCIGSCTNASYKDLATVAAILKGKVVHTGVSFVLSPGSRQVFQNLAEESYLRDLIAAGARIMESSCGFCIGNCQSPRSQSVSLRTSNRNFMSRSGTRDAEVYLVSAETAAAAVITGRITDPRKLGVPYPKIKMPEKYIIDDRMIIRPEDTADPRSVEIYRGNNIGEPPVNVSLPETIAGEVTIKVGDKITTDHIIPAGERMKYRSNIPKYSEFVFEVVDETFSDRAARLRDEGKHNIIVAGLSYGQGSSREHAAICPMYLGVKAVIAGSFERIHATNLVNVGILPLIFKNTDDYNGLERGDFLEIRNLREALGKEQDLHVFNLTKRTLFMVSYQLTDRQIRILLAGGALNYRKWFCE
jgi:aconitate hydratase